MAAIRQLTPTQVWVLAIRPKTLPAAVGPIVVGSALALAHGAFVWLPALACLFCALLLQVGSNLANDYFDHFRGADGADRLGPTRVTASGLLTPAQVRAGMVVVFGLAAVVGFYLVMVGGWPVLAAGLAAIGAALLYSGGPLPYGYYGLGEIFVFVFFGLVAVVGTYYVQAQAAPPVVWLAAVPAGALVTAILVVNNLRDRESDARAGKRTLAVLLGVSGARIEFNLLVAVAYVAAAVMAWATTAWALLPLISLPVAWRLVREMRTAEGRALNHTLAGTARLSLLFCALFAAGIVLS